MTKYWLGSENLSLQLIDAVLTWRWVIKYNIIIIYFIVSEDNKYIIQINSVDKINTISIEIANLPLLVAIFLN